MQSLRALAAILFASLTSSLSCSTTESPHEVSARESSRVDVDALRARLSKVSSPEGAGVVIVRFAESAAAAIQVSRPGQAGVSLSISAIDLPDVPTTVHDEHTRTSFIAGEGTDVVQLATTARYEELRRLSRPTPRIELRYRINLGPALSQLRVVDDRVEALDDRGVARMRSEPAFAIDARDVVRGLAPSVERESPGIFRVKWIADSSDLTPPIAIDPAWTTTATLPRVRNAGSAVTLPGKKVMLVGGYGTSGPTATSDIYDVATGSWTAGPSMSTPRANVEAVRLTDGRVFVGAGLGTTETVVAGDLYDPAKGTWKATVASPFGYGAPTSTPVSGARVLIIGLAGASLYDAKTDAWVATPSPAQLRVRHRGVLLASGQALIVGGQTSASGGTLSTAEVFDPATGTFSSAGSLSGPRVGVGFRGSFTLNALADGTAIVAGGTDGGEEGTVLDTIEIYDPSSKKWSAGPKMSTPRIFHSGSVMSDGRLMVVGGAASAVLLKSAEILDVKAKAWIPAGSMKRARESFGFAPIGDGDRRMLAIGGYDGSYVGDVEIYDPLAVGVACTGPGECLNGSCVDSVCCEKPSCASDETCAGSAAKGSCRKTNGQPCAGAADCGSGVCVDGTCCDRACDSICEACDVATSRGSCTTLAPGEAPHGTRPKCPGTGACVSTCGGIDAKACTIFPGAATPCTDASCAAGAESPHSFCDGAGACVPATKTKCEPYACGDVSCKHGCAVDADCATGYSCDARAGRCVFGAKCDGGHTVIVPGSPSIDCTPYKCGGASCLSKCASSDDCVSGTNCDTSSGKCVSAAAPAGNGGGCSTSPNVGRGGGGHDEGGAPSAGLGAVLTLLLLAATSRRRASGQVSR